MYYNRLTLRCDYQKKRLWKCYSNMKKNVKLSDLCSKNGVPNMKEWSDFFCFFNIDSNVVLDSKWKLVIENIEKVK